MDFLQIPKRTNKNRTYGITSIIDLGNPIGELNNVLEDYHNIIDIAKIGIGSAYITPNLKKKVDLYKEYCIKPYCGGTLFEKCYLQNKIDEYLMSLSKLGIEWVEVSNGTISIPLEERISLINKIKMDFHVIAEVGSKDCNEDMSISNWVEEMKLLLEAGCDYVITEGRESGTAGIYQQNGTVKFDLIHELMSELDCKKIIFEAPTPKHQMYFINQIGSNVNLGNVKLQDVLVLEAQRCGLRSETLYLEDRSCKLLL